ncbi:integrating conjugative element membrane protein, PFL_4697 family [Pseudomonas cedrina]|uniref:Integrating conjugative element membrane protein n=2 Tax=Pseudomonas cedrina TaxID=651740 RepID=A0A1V2K0F4_PSECE|nr:TIGR03747 family integrating conjugative element membrane protein [Pseudomonas cedrina]ONH50904.1 integrating conjugative element membrane protein [Pseudomonas cedrina subsp. cedrina]SDS62914.1 integrating conjugative element membrane protein, PFL_4697 family [Pseudomonas cedrina]
MRDPISVAHKQETAQRGLVVFLFTLPLRILGLLLGSLLLSLIIELVGMQLFWPEQGWRHAQAMMNFELQQFSTQFTRSLVVQAPGRIAYRWVTWLHESLLLDTGVLNWVERVNAQAQFSDTRRGFNAVVAQAVTHLENYVLAAFYASATFGLRVLLLVLTLPLFLLAAVTGMVDGLVRRDVRRFGAGRESGFVYHRARALLMPLALSPWAVYLALPISVHPLVILLPSALLLGIAIRITVASFKKYL